MRQGIENKVPADLEVAFLPYVAGGVYPGVYLFTNAARMMRPVQQLPSRAIELLGTLEQSTLLIRSPLPTTADCRLIHQPSSSVVCQAI